MSLRYLNAVLTMIALLLLAIFIVLLRSQGVGISFEQSAYAQTPPNQTDNLTFYPWINPRRFVFYDKDKSEIYIYDEDGELDATWIVGRMGDNLVHKKKR